MKHLFLIVLATLFLGSDAKAFELESFCREGRARNNCLQSFLQLKCSIYSDLVMNPVRDFACEGAAARFVDVLDLGNAPRLKGEKFGDEVVFKDELVDLIRDPATLPYLKALKGRLEEAVSGGPVFRFWDETLGLSGNSRNLAIKRVAVLFQDASTNPDDSSSGSSHIRYLKSLPIARSHGNVISLLDEVGTYFTPYALKLMPQIKIYPVGLDEYLNPTYYHFYVIVYATEALLKTGQSLEMSFFIPFLFNAQYEFKGMTGWPLKDPPGSEVSNPWKVREIYAGYLAAMSGVGKGIHAMKLEEFERKLQKSPHGLMKTLFSTRFDKKKRFTYGK